MSLNVTRLRLYAIGVLQIAYIWGWSAVPLFHLPRVVPYLKPVTAERFMLREK